MTAHRSVASPVTAALGGICLAAGVLVQIFHPAASHVWGALILVFSYAVPVAAYEIFVRRVHRNPSTGLVWSAPGPRDIGRVGLKLLGLAIVLGAVVAAHSVFRIYPVIHLVEPVTAAILLAPFALPLSVLYFMAVDRRMADPYDGYWQLGAWIMGRNPAPDWAYLRNFALGWAIKGFFLPIMFFYLAWNLPGLSAQIASIGTSPVAAAAYLTKVMITMELAIVVTGYTMTMRLFDAHIRSANPYAFAWIVTLVCYAPINEIVTSRVFDYRPDRSWVDVIEGYPALLWPWLVLTVISFFVWLWATAIFGLRWSNLTNRGTITNGPYAYTKHPDYVAKSAYFWLTAAPFLTAFTAWEAFAASAALIAVNLIYFGRGRMEERHMSEDPAYVAYALRMNSQSIFSPLARWLPFLRYVAPDGRTSAAPDDLPPDALPAE